MNRKEERMPISQTDRINHLVEVKTPPPGVEINFSFSNMQFLLEEHELPFDRASIRLFNFPGDGRVGSRHLIETLSRREQVSPENIFLAAGSSMANYVFWSILLKPGDEILVEFPTYEPMYRVPRRIGAEVRWLRREPADFSLTKEAVKRHLRDRTRMIVLTDSHNPSGNELSGELLDYLRDLARERGIWVMIDEVYGRFCRDRSLFVDYPEFIVSSSLSKFYGLGSLRAGWAFAPAPLVEKARDFLDFVSPELPFAPLWLTHLLLESPVMAVLEERIRQRIKRNRELVLDWLGRTDHVTSYIPRHGVLFFPEFGHEVDRRRFYRTLLEKYKMVLTRGELFQMPRHFRMAAIWDEKTLQEGLGRLASAVGESLK
jgi:aspartate/methionine/tyrosine aminotransferase